MNDVRNLMQSLALDIEYREFQNFGPGAPAGAAAPAAEAGLAETMRAAAARATRGVGAAGGLSLGRYLEAAPSPVAADRRAPLSEVFARLAGKAAR